MNVYRIWRAVLGAGMIAAMLPATMVNAWPVPLDTAFTYQGRLKSGGSPANGLFNLDFDLFDDAVAGNLVMNLPTINNVPVTDGLFTVQLDYGAAPFDGDALWLQIAVNGTPLSPRQPITVAPYALQTRGIFVNDAMNFAGIGRTTSIGTDEILGLGRATDGFAGMYISTNAAGEPYYGYSAGGNIDAFHYFDSATNQWRLNLQGLNRVFVSASFMGIGRSTPVSGAEDFGIQSPATNGFFGGMYINTAGDTGMPFYGYSTNGVADAFHFFDGPNDRWTLSVGGAARMTVIATTGSIGIGTLAPGFMLHVNGTAGKPGGGSWSVASDARLKKNVADLDGALEQLLQLRGVTFEYIDPAAANELPGQRLGMIAQEVEQVFPDWIDVKPDGYKTLTYRGFEALTVEAPRELRQEKDDELRALRDENANLRQRLDTIETMLQAAHAQAGDLP